MRNEVVFITEDGGGVFLVLIQVGRNELGAAMWVGGVSDVIKGYF